MTDRRGHVRAVACGTARVAGVPAVLAIRDLSVGGARLVGGAQLVEGHRVRLELSVEGATMTVDADVLRVDRQRQEAAVTFHNLAAETRAWIERCVAALIDRVRAAGPPVVLVTGLPAERAATLERDLARLDRAMQVCAGQPEIETALRDPERICAVVIGSAAPIADLVALLRAQHPVVKRVLLFGEQLESIDHDISRAVDAVLRTPWRIRALAKAIGIESADSTAAMLPQSE
jgi:hypothetical protein